MRRGLCLLLLVWLGGPPGGLFCGASVAGTSGAAHPAHWRGRRLVDALEDLRGMGLRLTWSSATVTADRIVTVEPEASEPRRILDAILAPLGLEARDGPGGALLIVRGDPRTGHDATLRGRVTSAATGQPVAGAQLRVESAGRSGLSRPDGSFRIPGVPAGAQDLDVSAAGFVARRVEGIPVAAGRSREIVVPLQPQPGYVEEVVVTPSRRSLQREEPSPRLTLDQQDVDLVPQIGSDPARAVESLPGVAAPDNSAAFNLRGSEAKDVSLVLDGLELYEPFHLATLQAPWSVVDSALVDRIDLLGGGFTADLGDRRGGFVEMSTALPEGPERLHAAAGSIESGFSYGAPTSAGDLLIAARAFYPEALGTTMEIGEPGLEPRFADLYVKSSVVASPHTAVSFHALVASDRLDFHEQHGNEAVRLTEHSAHLWARLLQAPSPRLAIETVVSAGRLQHSRVGDAEPEDEVILVDDERRVNFFGLRSDATWEARENHLLRFGIQARPLAAEYRYTSGPADDPAAMVPLRLDPDGSSYGAYAAWRAGLGARVTLETGVRWDRQSYTGDDEVSPRLNAVWHPGDRTSLRLGFGRFTQSQRIQELDVADGETLFHPAESSRQADLTVDHRTAGGVRIRFDGYYAAITRPQPRYENLFNPIELFPEVSPDRVRIDPDGARLRGAELFLGSDPARRFSGWGSYAWSAADDVVDGRAEPRAWDQPHALRLAAAWRPQRSWTFSTLLTLRSGWPTTPVTGEAVLQPDGTTEIVSTPGPRNSDRLPSYARLDLRGAWTAPVSGGRLGVEVNVTNVTNR
ncbi:MAG TPA: TonB-dependent receptor, partial [Candidatus Polarisedimenticolia bacterium]|nr:TonB-dependent receptor [Candidatus Polarisedimenticolia bacterium]